MTPHRRRRRRRGHRRGPRLPDQPRAACARRAGPRAEVLRGAGPADHPAGPRRATASCAPATWDEALDLVADRLARASGPTHGPDAVARVRRRRADQREGLPARQVRPGRAAAPRNIDYNGRFCMSSAAAAAATGPSGIDRGLPFPLDRPRRRRRGAAGRQQPRRDDAAVRSQHLAGAAARGGARRGRPAAHRHRRPRRGRPGCTCSRCRAPTSRSRSACCTSSLAEGLVDADYVAARTTGFEEVRRVGRAVVARAGRAGDRRPGADAARGRAPAGRGQPVRGGRGAIVLTGRGAEQHARAPTPSPPRSTSRSRSACPAACGSGYGCLTGQGNGQGGREHGQKADQLPGYRMIDDPAARAHVAAVWGVDPDVAARHGRAGRTSCSTRSAPTAARARCSCSAPTCVVSAPNAAARRASGSRALDLLVVCDFVLSETAGWPTSCCPSPSGPRRRAR